MLEVKEHFKRSFSFSILENSMTLVVFIERNQGSEVSQIGLDLDAWDRKTQNNNDLNRKEEYFYLIWRKFGDRHPECIRYYLVFKPKLLLSYCSPIFSTGFHFMVQDGCLSFSHPLHSTKEEGPKKGEPSSFKGTSGSCTHTMFPYNPLAKT